MKPSRAQHRPSRARGWLLLGGGLIVVALAYLGGSALRRAMYAARLPPPPNLSAATPAVRSHLMNTDRTARARVTSAERVGALGLTYQSDMFYEQAEKSYAVAEELSPSLWRWRYYWALVQEAGGEVRG